LVGILKLTAVSKRDYMQNEYETQILNIDEKEIRKKLKKIGAKPLSKKFHRRFVYDINPNGCSEWLRLRTDGKKTTICYKLRKDHTPNGTQELEIGVDDFDKTAELLSKLSFFTDKFYQENISQIFTLDDIEFKIDRWPMIPTMFEIEAKSENGVKNGLKLLGLEGKEYGHHGHIQIYREYGIDLHSHKELKFEERKKYDRI